MTSTITIKKDSFQIIGEITLMTIDLNERLLPEYERWTNQIGNDVRKSSSDSLNILDVLDAHFLVANFFFELGEGIAGFGPRDINLLHSALSRQHISFGKQEKWNRPLEKAATLFYGIIMNHPFIDANKRTALICLLYHLQKNKFIPTCTNKELEDFAVRVANNKLDKYSVFKENIKKKDDDPHVKTIYWYIKKNTRRIDKNSYAITYARLKKILNQFGYDLQNASGNTIDVVRIKERPKILGLIGPKEKIGVKVAQIGFPSWTKEVRAGAIKTVREKTGLTPEKGCDSATFFKDVEPTHGLLAKYQEPLINLAHR